MYALRAAGGTLFLAGWIIAIYNLYRTAKQGSFAADEVAQAPAGRPVVATDVGGARESIVHGETVYLVPAGDHEQLAHHVIAILSDAESARSLGEAGRRRVNEKFSSLKQLQNVESLYTELLPRKRTKSTNKFALNVHRY